MGGISGLRRRGTNGGSGIAGQILWDFNETIGIDVVAKIADPPSPRGRR
jgi:hypothetical protein